ncbi:restriction endonuclease [Protaetiibacter sp. SSC-01]|uniref:McrC family protein n=1 Tax=Protaetiibacter sp. SSC-01 TaxID=2759943 RepID=UPI001656D75C|nr:restriction endonuclease [Protaetiibacter sp. SSC-01]QNO36702.1 restriction endonuclease [Protaetiibacter sp. SSC-01]
MTRYEVREADTAFLKMPLAAVQALTSLGVCTASPAGDAGWRVSNVAKVGAISFPGGEVHIQPKLEISRLFWMLGTGRQWGDWRDGDVELNRSDTLSAAIAESFAHFAEAALRRGILQGYRSTEATETAVRGKWLISEQVRRRSGLVLPVELQYDDYVADIAENRAIRGAAIRALRFPSLPPSLRRRLERIERELFEVAPGTHKSSQSVFFDRRNSHYRPAIELAGLILAEDGIDHGAQGARSRSYLLDLAKMFEDFIEAEVRRAARNFPGTITAQHRGTLDQAQRVDIRPDLVWSKGGRVRAILDAKYKTEKPHRGHPNPDIYQMLAYCIRYGVRAGHLIYAKGNADPARYVIEQAGVTIVCHALDLSAEPAQIERQVDWLVADALGPDLQQDLP